ncbi:MAG: phage baseplate assembly protein V [Chloroflexota bacterium]
MTIQVPSLTLLVSGQALPDKLLQTLQEVRVQQRLSHPTQCELTFQQPDEAIADWLQRGEAIQVEVENAAVPLFVGEITAVEYSYGPSGMEEIRVRGYDLLHRLRKQQQVRSHVQLTVRDLAEELSNDLGLQVNAEKAGPIWPFLFQTYASDLALLAATAERCGLYLTLREQMLHLLTLQEKPDTLSLVRGGNLLEARLEQNDDATKSSVNAASWSPLRVESYQAEASNGETDFNLLDDILLDEPNSELALLNGVALDEMHTQALAQAEWDRRQATATTFWGVAAGDPQLQPGKTVAVSGVAQAVAGNYVLTEVTHLINGRYGYITELNTQPPQKQKRPFGSTATVGTVTQVNDPQDLGRVRVSLPTFGEVETDWMHVLSPGGGQGKGLIAIPEAGDNVLVLLSQHDPGQGVVLGGLFGMGGPPDSGVEGGKVQQYSFVTRGGQRIRLDDAANSVRLENSRGSYLEMRPGRVRLRSRTSLHIEAPGQAIVIKGKTIDFEQG